MIGRPRLRVPHRRTPNRRTPGPTASGAESASACPIHRITAMAPARALLRWRGASTQAGFTAEKIPEGFFARRPLLIADDPGHDARRKELGRFFAPRAVRHHEEFMRETARRMVGEAAGREICVDRFALHYSVAVASRVVGLRGNRIAATSRRLERFFTQPPVDYSREDYGRSNGQWALAALRGIGAVGGFFLGDVLPAVRDHRRRPRQDPIGALLAQGAGLPEILAEAMTYATAGMVTTREFIVMALWTLLEDPELRERYAAADAEGRDLLLREVLRAEPVVGHLYRRVRVDVVPEDVREAAGPAVGSGETAETEQWRPGRFVDLDVRAANRDPAFAGPEPETMRADRGLRRQDAAGLSFGSGTHQCPGEHLALAETRILLDELLRHEPVLNRAPDRTEDSLIAGYRLRGMLVRLCP